MAARAVRSPVDEVSDPEAKRAAEREVAARPRTEAPAGKGTAGAERASQARSSAKAVAPRLTPATEPGGPDTTALSPSWAQEGELLTTAGGVPVEDSNNSLRVGPRGRSLLEDHHLREKVMHFDHERIPERVVHARGAAAHGTFTCFQSQSHLTCASFLAAEGKETPVFARFSTVAGSRGSADTARVIGEETAAADVKHLDEALFDRGPMLHVIAAHGGEVDGIAVHKTFHGFDAVEVDALVLAPGALAASAAEPKVGVMVQEAFRHHKPLAAWGDGAEVLDQAGVPRDAPGVVVDAQPSPDLLDAFVEAVGWHRHWER